MRTLGMERRFAGAVAAVGMWLMLCGSLAPAADDAQYKTVEGLSAYLGVVPAELVKGSSAHAGEKPMHGRIPKGPHEFHIIIALFDAGT